MSTPSYCPLSDPAAPGVATDSGLVALARHTSGLIPVLRPKLPSSVEIIPYLQTIDHKQWYSNWGPLVRQLESKLSDHLGLETPVVATANATVALTAALLALEVPRGSLCLMPSWTFSATPHAAFAAGLEPWFHDVDCHTWALDPDEVLRTVKTLHGRAGAVMVVSPFGAPLDVAAWEDFQGHSGLPVVIDAAASFDTVKASRIPSVVSLHATKILASGEGGFVATTDRKLRERVAACCNFGFRGSRSSILPALNAKMSEYHAAVGLASLANWPRTRARHLEIVAWYRAAIERMQDIVLQPGYGSGWASGTTSVVLPGDSLAVMNRLAERDVETRSWWGAGCHVQPAFSGCPRGALPVTEDLGRRVLGLPHFSELRESDVETVVRAVAEAVGEGIAERLRVA